MVKTEGERERNVLGEKVGRKEITSEGRKWEGEMCVRIEGGKEGMDC